MKGEFMSKEIFKDTSSDITTVLTEGQKDMLFFIYQEEKVARDVYIALGKIYKNENIFTLVQISKQVRIDFVRDLCDTYGVETSHIDEDAVGKFELPVMQILYDVCTEEGGRSLLDAYKMAELIEVTDIDDLEQASIGMPDDVVSVYKNLREKSLRRLNSFQTAIAKAA